jgi:hypothetical protein
VGSIPIHPRHLAADDSQDDSHSSGLNLGLPAPPIETAMLDDRLQSLDDVNLLGLIDLSGELHAGAGNSLDDVAIRTESGVIPPVAFRVVCPAGKSADLTTTPACTPGKDGFESGGPRELTRDPG